MKHWVFDLDGTLVDSHKSYEESIDLILRDMGITPIEEHFERAYKYFNPQEYFATFFESEKDVLKALNKLIELNHIFAPRIAAFPGLIETLDHLRSRDVKVSVWTGRDLATAQVILQHSGLGKHVGLCVGRTCVVNNKPHPDGLLKILKDSKDHGDDVIMIGDHEYDMLGARAAGVKGYSVGWSWRHQNKAVAHSEKHFDKISDFTSWAKAIIS